MRPEDHPLARRDWVALSLPGLIWGSSFFLIAEGLESFEPFLVTWLRIVFGLLVVACVPATRQPVPRPAWPRLALLGVVWVAIPLSLFPLAEQHVSSSVTGMLNGATPIFTAIVAALIVRRLPPGRQIAGLVTGLVGIVLIAAPTWSDGGSSSAATASALPHVNSEPPIAAMPNGASTTSATASTRPVTGSDPSVRCNGAARLYATP